jgi:hypothetical protein
MLKVVTGMSEWNDSLNTTEPYRTRGEIENLISAFDTTPVKR